MSYRLFFSEFQHLDKTDWWLDFDSKDVGFESRPQYFLAVRLKAYSVLYLHSASIKKKNKPKPCKMESKLYRFIKGLNNIMIVDICLAYSSNTETTLFCLSWHYSVPLNFIYSLYIQRGSVLRYREQNSGYQWGEGREKA